MPSLVPTRPVEYLLIGHICKDLTPQGPVLGGTAAYSGLTARALGFRVGVVTSCGPDLDISPLASLEIVCVPSETSTTFENRYAVNGRIQVLHARASLLSPESVPGLWGSPQIVHLGPVAQEVDPDLVSRFPTALVCLTPQGWMRGWDSQGRVDCIPWAEQERLLGVAHAAVISLEDVQGDEAAIEEMAELSRLLVVTEAADGARVYWNRDLRRIPAPAVAQVDPTGSGDIFAAAFFTRLFQTRDPWEAARFANLLASASLARRGIAGTPTPAEVEAARRQVIP
jgi:hypothetical protein